MLWPERMAKGKTSEKEPIILAIAGTPLLPCKISWDTRVSFCRTVSKCNCYRASILKKFIR